MNRTNIYEDAINTLSMPIRALNILSGIISGIWLAILGEWNLLLIGLSIGITGAWIIYLFLFPSMLLFTPGVISQNKINKYRFLFFAMLSILYTIAVASAWCLGILRFFMTKATSQNLIPLLIWSYGNALYPWGHMALKKQSQDNNAFALSVILLFASLSYMVIIILLILNYITFAGAVIILCSFMAIALLSIFITSLITFPKDINE